MLWLWGSAMNLLRSIFRTLKRVFPALAVWALVCELALADRTLDIPQQGGSATDYTVPYALFMAGVALGLFVVLRASGRRERERPQQYVEKNVLKEE